MGFFVLLILFLLAGFAGIVTGRAMKRSNPDSPGGAISVGSGIGMVILIALMTALFTFHTVDNGEIGIVKQFGPVVDTTSSGFVSILPWQSLDTVSVKNELRTFDMDTANSAVSADSQAIYMIVQVNYSLERERAVELYQKTGGDYEARILNPAVYQLTKEVTAEYKAVEVAAHREKIRREIETRIDTEVEPQGIKINAVSLKNVHFTDELTKAIESTVEAQQLALRADAQVKIKDAEARQAVAEARGLAKAQKLRNVTLTPLLLKSYALENQKLAIQTLNDNVTLIICDTKSLCIPNAGALLQNFGK